MSIFLNKQTNTQTHKKTNKQTNTVVSPRNIDYNGFKFRSACVFSFSLHTIAVLVCRALRLSSPYA